MVLDTYSEKIIYLYLSTVYSSSIILHTLEMFNKKL